MIVTIIMTFKDTFLGAYIYAASGDTKDVVIASVLFLLSTLLPTLLTIVIMGMISKSAIEAIKYVQNEQHMESSESLMTDKKLAQKNKDSEMSQASDI